MMKKLLLNTVKISERIGLLSGVVAAVFVTGISLIVFWGVIMRYVFNHPQVWVDPSSIYMMIGLTFIGASYAMQKEKHVRVDVIIGLFNKRQQMIIQIVTYLIALVYTLILGILAFNMAYGSFLVDRRDATVIETPLFIPQSSIPIGCAFLLISIIGKMVGNICVLKGWMDKTEST
jgi:TRAP-type C4-dicarboxylate transport system permease small subunit